VKTILILSIVLGTIGTNGAQQTKTQQAVALLESNRVEEAYDILTEAYAEDPDDIQTTFMLGMASLKLGKNDEAISYFEAILKDNPELPRVRLELARAYAANGETRKARNEFSKVLETDLPPQVRENVNRFLSLLEDGRALNAWASVGYLYDDNVNAGPSTDQVTFFGLPFALDPAAKQQSDSAVVANVVADYTIPTKSEETDIVSTFLFRSVNYCTWSRFDSQEFVVTAGPRFKAERMQFRVPLIFDYAFLGSDRYGMGYGVGPELRYAIRQDMSINGSVIVERKRYFSRDERTGHLWAVDLHLRKLLSNQSFIDIGYQHWREYTKVEFLDNNTHTVYAGLYTNVFSDMSLFVGPSVSWNAYDEREAALDRARDDFRTRVNLNLSKRFENDIELALGYTHTYNDSNLSLYEFRRNQVTLQIAKYF